MDYGCPSTLVRSHTRQLLRVVATHFKRGVSLDTGQRFREVIEIAKVFQLPTRIYF